jgi:predicted Zn-dependent protease
MKTLSKVTALALLLSLGAVTITAPVSAAPDAAKIEERKKRKTKVMGERVGKKIMKVFDVYNGIEGEKEGDVKAAYEMLLEIEASDPFDAASVNRYKAVMLFQLERFDEALKSAKEAVKPDALNFKDQADLLKTIGDLEMLTKRYKDARQSYYKYIDFTGEQDARIYEQIASSYYQTKEFSKILEPADRAIELSKKEPRRAPFDLKIGAYVELKQLKNAVKVAEQRVKIWPEEPKNWVDLASFYLMVEDFKAGLSAIKVAERNNGLSTESHYKVLSSLYSLNEMYYQSAKSLEKAVKDGKVKKEKAIYENIAANYRNAKENVKAANYYVVAADFEKEKDGDLYALAGAMLVQVEKYNDAIELLNKSLEYGVKKEGNVYTDLADAYLNLGKYKQSYQAIVKAQDYPESKKFAKQWSTLIKDKAIRKGVKL